MPATDIETAQLCVSTIRFLSADAVEKARSGHPGAPMGAADFAFVLWANHLRFDPDDPAWPNRDRFLLSAGHASMLLYSLLHLFEFDLPLSELERFRQIDSRTPGHPERGRAPGVEVTTGPLGQGFANGVGMALAQRMARERLGSEADLLDHRVFVLASDGDLMEGVSAEAASLAGHWKLGNLIVLYDDNRISIEGDTRLAFSEDVALRFGAQGWHVLRVDGHDHVAVDEAIGIAAAETDRPSLLICRTRIARGAPTKEGSARAHGEPLGAEEVAQAKAAAGWPAEPAFHVPEEARAYFHSRAEAKRADRIRWQRRFDAFRHAGGGSADGWEKLFGAVLPPDLEATLAAAAEGEGQGLATRAYSGAVIQSAARALPGLVGGSADLAPSTLTTIRSGGSVVPEGALGAVNFAGRNLHYGVREHAMGAISNGLALYGGWIPYCGTFLIFSDYMRPPIRLAALMDLRVVYVFTHDSFHVGEDGPTHQPVEQLAALRLIPGLHVWRPADGAETAMAWSAALRRADGPTAICLTRQKVAPLPASPNRERIARGGYVVADPRGGVPDVTLVATGSEVALAVQALAPLERAGVRARVASIPCVEVFLAQTPAYRASVLPPDGPFALIEAGATDGWCALLGRDALRIGMDRFGASAPAGVLAERFGFTAEEVVRRVLRHLGRA